MIEFEVRMMPELLAFGSIGHPARAAVLLRLRLPPPLVVPNQSPQRA